MTETSLPLASTPSATQPTLRDYAVVSGLLVSFCVLLSLAPGRDGAVDANDVIAPMGALFALTAAIWLTMVVVRNYATLRGLVSADYYLTYSASTPSDWIERPARTFNNLMQVPSLFYVICLLMLHTQRFDAGQIALAWIFVAMRTLHALIYIVWNPLPYRFASWAASCITLGTIWARFYL